MSDKPKIYYALDDQSFTALRNFHMQEFKEFIDKKFGKENLSFVCDDLLTSNDDSNKDIEGVLHCYKENRVILFQTKKECQLSNSNFIENTLLVEFIKHRSKQVTS